MTNTESVPPTLSDQLNAFQENLYDARRQVANGRGTYFHPDLEDEEQAIVDNFLSNSAFELAGLGRGRCVLHLPPNSEFNQHVVKVARYGDDNTSDGIEQNVYEADAWETLQEEYAADSLPVLPVSAVAADDTWLVMPAGTPIDVAIDDPEEQERLLDSVKSRLAHVEFIDENEITVQNVVVIDGEAFLADYGSPPYDYDG